MIDRMKVQVLKNALCKGCREGWPKVRRGVHHDVSRDGEANYSFYEQCLADNAFDAAKKRSPR